MEDSKLLQEECPCCSGKHKERDEKEYKDLMNRLKRIEGQVRGVENMLENGVYCTDILIQTFDCFLKKFVLLLLSFQLHLQQLNYF